MSISRTKDLFQLVQSMTKAEKRAFRSYAGRLQDSDQLLYIRLFDIMQKMKTADDKVIKRQLGVEDTVKFSNLKRHLYRQILTSLRLLHQNRTPSINVREQIDFAYVLYGKGLYTAALKVLEKAKKTAETSHLDFLALVVVEFQKVIHSRHVTHSKAGKIEALLDASKDYITTLTDRISLSNLRMRLHKFYVEKGHVKNDEEHQEVLRYFEENKPIESPDGLGLIEQVYWYQSHVWYYYILNDFESCLENARRWVALFSEHSDMPARDIDLYLRGFHYALTSAFNLNNLQVFIYYQKGLEAFRNKHRKRFNENSRIIALVYTYTARLNRHFLEKSYEQGVDIIPRLNRRIRRYGEKVDAHKMLVFYFKFAYMYLMASRPENAIDYLLKIINDTDSSLRIDIQVYARLMFLMAHYDLDNIELIRHLTKQYGRFFKKHDLASLLPNTMLRFFMTIVNAPLLERKKVVAAHYDKLRQLAQNPYEKRAFLYLDCLSWMGRLSDNNLPNSNFPFA